MQDRFLFLHCRPYGPLDLLFIKCSLCISHRKHLFDFMSFYHNLPPPGGGGGCGGTDLERGYGDVRPWRPPFHASPVARKGPISSKRVSSQDPLLRKFGNISLNSLNFHPNFSSQAPKFGNFQLTSPQIWKFSAHKPQIWKFSAHKPPFSEANVSSQAPHFGNPGRTHPTWKKVEFPPPPGLPHDIISYPMFVHVIRKDIYGAMVGCRITWGQRPNVIQHPTTDIFRIAWNKQGITNLSFSRLE